MIEVLPGGPSKYLRADCRCCVERIIGIFESAGDWERYVLCRRRLRELEDVESDED